MIGTYDISNYRGPNSAIQLVNIVGHARPETKNKYTWLVIILLLPLIIVAVPVFLLIYYPISILLLGWSARESRKLHKMVITKVDSFNYEEIMELYSLVKKVNKKIGEIVADDEFQKSWFFKPMTIRVNKLFQTHKAIEELLIPNLYSTPKIDYSKEEIDALVELNDFFGDDEDEVYSKDTFKQLRKNRENNELSAG